MSRPYWPLTAVLSVAIGSPAVACRVYLPAADVSVIHKEVPAPLAGDLLVLDVQFAHADGGWEELFKGARATVKKVIQGHYSGKVVIVRENKVRVTCYNPIRYEGSGIVIGKPVGYENGFLVLQPVFASRTR